MLAFTQFTPTEIVFGPDAQSHTAEMVKKHGGTRALVVYGEGSVVKSGLLDNILKQLAAQGIECLKYGGATPNPHLSFARAGVKAAIEFEADFVLAIGGGSAIDAAKAIAHGAKNPNIDIWKFWLREETVMQSLPVGVVLTISAAGSETSSSAVLTNTDEGRKRGLNTDFNRPRFAIMNPELTFTLPKYQISCGIADIMMHTMDRYFSPECGKSNQITDEIAEGILKVVIQNGPVALENPKDYHAQSEIMWCGSLSHNGISGLGRTMDFSVHQLGHELGGRFDVAHGASLTTMWGHWARHVLPTNPARFARFARNVWQVETDSKDDTIVAEEGIRKTETYFKAIGMPTCFTELGIGVQTEAVLDQLADSCVWHGKRLVGTFKPSNKSDIMKMYQAANK